jgi:hypothetical protein
MVLATTFAMSLLLSAPRMGYLDDVRPFRPCARYDIDISQVSPEGGWRHRRLVVNTDPGKWRQLWASSPHSRHGHVVFHRVRIERRGRPFEARRTVGSWERVDSAVGTKRTSDIGSVTFPV